MVHLTLGGEEQSELETVPYFFCNGKDGEALEFPLSYERVHQVFGRPLMIYLE